MRMIDDTNTLQPHSCLGYAAPHYQLTVAVRISAKDRLRYRQESLSLVQRKIHINNNLKCATGNSQKLLLLLDPKFWYDL